MHHAESSFVVQEVFRNPVLARDGRTFERDALLSWWASHDTFPQSQQIAHDRTLVPNAALRAAIMALYGKVSMRPQPKGLCWPFGKGETGHGCRPNF